MKTHGRTRLVPLIALAAMVPARGASWLETRDAIEALAAANDFIAATALGDELLAAARETFGDDSDELADAHMLLARVQRDAGEILSAEGNVVAAITILGSEEDPDSAALIGPYRELGDLHFLGGDYATAISAFEEAVALGHREFGLLNPGQIAILERMSLSAESLGDEQLAEDYRAKMFEVAARHYGYDSLEYIGAAYEYARWLSEHRDTPQFFPDEVRAITMEIQRVIDEHFDADPKLTIERLRFASEFAPRPPGIAQPVDLYEALGYVEALDVPDPALHARILLDLGDWYLSRGRNDALERYREAWDMLGTFSAGEALRSQWFSDVVAVKPGSMESRYVTLDRNAPLGFVTVEFNIDTAGKAQDIHVILSDPPDVLDRAAVRFVSDSTFRPQIVDGRFVKAGNQVTWRFHYELDGTDELLIE